MAEIEGNSRRDPISELAFQATVSGEYWGAEAARFAPIIPHDNS
jgi:hypothetical protein